MVKYFLSLVLFIPTLSTAQSWDFSAAEKLPGGINTAYEETLPLLSPDGKTLYFTRILNPENIGGKFSGSDIWIGEFDEKKKQFGAAKNPKNNFNDAANNAVVGVGAKGDVIYMLNTTSGRKTDGIYFSRRLNNRWSKPEFVSLIGIETEGFIGMYVSPDFDVIFLSMKAPDSRGEEDLYISLKSSGGNWSKPVNLGPSINSAGFEIAPFLSQDKKRLYFASNGFEGFGDADIFYSDRLYNSWDTWTAPRNLGPKLNTNKFDAYFSLYGDSVAYFASNRDSKYADLYRINVVPGNETLGFRQHYLTAEEGNKLLGANVSRRITFEEGKTQLSAAQQELLFFIADKLASYKNVNLQLLVLEDNNPKLTEARMTTVVDQLKSAGMEISRLLISTNEKNRKSSQRNTTIELLLFE